MCARVCTHGRQNKYLKQQEGRVQSRPLWKLRLGEELGEVKGRETVIRIYHVRGRNLFSIKVKKEKREDRYRNTKGWGSTVESWLSGVGQAIASLSFS